MSETQIVAPERLVKLKQLQDNYDSMTKRYGELRFQELLIEDEMAQLSIGMRNLEIERSAMVTQIQTDFGSTGAVNLQTGEFIPD